MFEKIKTLFDSSTIGSFTILLVVLVITLQWVTWMFGWGRFRHKTDHLENNTDRSENDQLDVESRTPIRHVVANLFVKVIDDFRHLLALIIILMFVVVLVYVLYIAGTDVDKINKALQAVTGSLSGIIGVIIGYYFGESTARFADSDRSNPTIIAAGINDQLDPSTDKQPTLAPPPPKDVGE